MVVDNETQVCTRLDPHQDYRVARRAAVGLNQDSSIVYRLIFLFWDATDPATATPLNITSTATSTSFSTLSRPLLSSTPPHTCRVLCSTWCPC